MYIYTYIYIHIHIYMYIYICIFMHIHICIYIYIQFMYLYKYIYTYVLLYICIDISIFVYIYRYIHFFIRIHSYIGSYIYTCTHSYIHIHTNIHIVESCVFVYIHPCMHIESSSFYSLPLQHTFILILVALILDMFKGMIITLGRHWCGYTLGLDTMAASHIGPLYLVLHRMFITHEASIFGLASHVWCCIACSVLHRPAINMSTLRRKSSWPTLD